ncbi:MAG: hypothetical protein ABIB04_04725 [Patescibacteria group bacterium]
MKLLPTIKRSVSAEDLLKICFAISFMSGLLSAILSDSGMPGIQQIILGTLPFYAISTVVTIVFWLMAGRERSTDVVSGACALVLIGASIGIIASFFKIWNDGSSYLILSPYEAWLNIISFGLYPTRFGSLVQIRFLPLVVFLGLGIFLSRSGVSKAKSWLYSGGAYLTLIFSYNFMSLIAWLGSRSLSQTVSTTADTFRVLVRLHSISYWSQSQLDRFLLPIGRQAESTLLMTHASIIFLITTALLILIFIKSIRVPTGLVKRISTKNSVLWVLPVAIGVSLSLTSQGPRTSYTDVLALIIFIIVILSWIAWWRFGRDMDNLAQDELHQVDLPLPRGEVSLQDLESIRNVLLTVCLFGAWILGWPVFLGIFSASIAMWFLSRYGAGLGDSLLTSSLGNAVIGLSLSWVGAAVALRDASSPAWITRMLFGAAILVGLSRLIKDLGDAILTSRYVIWIFISALLVIPLITKQNFIWIPVIGAAVFAVWAYRDTRKWRHYGIYFMDLALVLMAFITLFIPQLIRHL